MPELTPPPLTPNISNESGAADPLWLSWFQEIWDKSRGGFQELFSQTIDSDENLEFLITDKVSGFKDYKIVFDNVLVSQPLSYIYLQVSEDLGATYNNSSADYSWIISLTGTTSYKQYDNADSQMRLLPGNMGNTISNVLTGEIIFYDISGGAPVKFFRWDIRYKDSDGNISLIRGAGSYNDTDAINGIKFFTDKGKFTSGELDIFGAK